MTGDGAKPRASAWTGVFRVKAHPGGEPWPYGPSWRERFSFLEGREQALRWPGRPLISEGLAFATRWDPEARRVRLFYDSTWPEEDPEWK